jgi:hypothetical protein
LGIADPDTMVTQALCLLNYLPSCDVRREEKSESHRYLRRSWAAFSADSINGYARAESNSSYGAAVCREDNKDNAS